MEILKCSNLKKQIKNKIIVENISFSINKGDIVGFIGPNGAGKTTIIKLILGLIKLSEGKVFINRFDIEKLVLLLKIQTYICTYLDMII